MATDSSLQEEKGAGYGWRLSHVLPSIVAGVPPLETAALKCAWVAFSGREQETL